MSKQIQVRRDTASNWTTNNPTLSSGEIGYETDTGKIKVGDGTTAWTSLDYIIQQLDVTTKGDLQTYSTQTTRLGVGTNNQLLSADSTEPTGLKWIDPPASSPLTTKGDIYTYDTDNARLPVGTNGQILSADSTQATGLNWVDGTFVADMNIEIFTTSGTYTKPSNLLFAIVEVVGGGAGGGGVSSAVGQTANSGGGGGGGFSRKKILASSLGATETVTIGSGGAGGTGNSNGTDGGTSSFGTHCSATGGSGGAGNAPSSLVPRRGLTCGAGGTGTGGDINTAGLIGPNGFNLALANYGQVSGGGGASMYGSGGAQMTATNTNGNNGAGFGGGGSGVASYNVASNYTGGAGTNGVVIVYEYLQ